LADEEIAGIFSQTSQRGGEKMRDSRKSTGRARLTDLAQAAGVSVSTVDRVINGRDPVRRQTAEKVLQAAQSLGFRGAARLTGHWSAERPALRFAASIRCWRRKS
jgi:LacI family transcriptional regulator